MVLENLLSLVVHRSLVNLDVNPSEWKTFCGWEFAGKRHAKTHRQDYVGTCFNLDLEASSESDSND